MPSLTQKKENIFCTSVAMAPVQRITPFPSFNNKNEEATSFHEASLFERYYEVLSDYEEFWTDKKFDALRTVLSDLSSLQANWNTYNAEPPSPEAIHRADAALAIIRAFGYQPSTIVASGEGGVAICFSNASSYADIEFSNSGETLAVAYRNNEEPQVWALDDSQQEITKTLKQIHGKFNK